MNGKRSYDAVGFTLIELAVVIVVMSLITGMGLIAALEALESTRRAATQSKLDVIERALHLFRDANNRLPCPADITLSDDAADFGIEAANRGRCYAGAPAAMLFTSYYYHDDEEWPTTVKGAVPVKALGLPDTFIYDGWGRKIAYVVDSIATTPGAFTTIPPNATDCSITVWDAAAGARSGGAIYTLISHGSNGHGAFVNGPDRVSWGSTNSAELINCQCDSTGAAVAGGPLVVQKEYSENPDDSLDVFDDIVRFKERWQLMNADDRIVAANTREYQVAFGFAYGGFGSVPQTPIVFYKRGCRGWTPARTPVMTLTAGNGWSHMAGLVFTPDNRHLFGHFYNTIFPYCASIDVGVEPPVATTYSCSNYLLDDAIAASRNGFVAFSYQLSPPFVMLYRYFDGEFLQMPASGLLSPEPAAKPQIMAFSRNADYLALARTTDNVYFDVFGKTDDASFRRLVSTSQPVTTGYGNVTAASFSPDGRFLAVAESATRTVKLWELVQGTPFVDSANGGTSPFSALPALGPFAYAPIRMAFSQDGRYFAVGLNSNTWAISDNIKIFLIDGDAFLPVTIDAGTDYYEFMNITPHVLAFTANGQSLLMSGQNSNYVVTLDRIAPDRFRQIVDAFVPAAYYASPDQRPPSALAVAH